MSRGSRHDQIIYMIYHLKSTWQILQHSANKFNTLRLRWNGQHFTDDIFKCILFNENVWIFIKMSLKFIHKSPINDFPALFKIMTWHHPGDNSLSEPMMVSLLTHICATRPKWVNPCGPICIHNADLVITVSEDVLAPNGARPSADMKVDGKSRHVWFKVTPAIMISNSPFDEIWGEVLFLTKVWFLT